MFTSLSAVASGPEFVGGAGLAGGTKIMSGVQLERGAQAEHFRASAAVSWPAIFAGAFVAAGVTVILLAMGSGLGFASFSPWSDHGVSAVTFTITAVIWLLVTQWVSAGLGGYIAGRLRSRWHGTHVHEVFFRDTAHGLITWAVATVLIALSMATSLATLLGGGTHGVPNAASGAMSAALSGDSGYALDKLFRSAVGSAGAQAAGDPRMEATHIMINAIRSGSVPDADRTYLAATVAERTGLTQAEAQKRVDVFITDARDTETQFKADADTARRAAAEASLYLALSLLIGAFIASVAAALGGRLRDEHA